MLLIDKILAHAASNNLALTKVTIEHTRYQQMLTRLEESLTENEMDENISYIAKKIGSNEKAILDPFTYQQDRLQALCEALEGPLCKDLELVGTMEIDRLNCVRQFTTGVVLKDVNECVAEMILDRALRMCLSKYGKYFSNRARDNFKGHLYV